MSNYLVPADLGEVERLKQFNQNLLSKIALLEETMKTRRKDGIKSSERDRSSDFHSSQSRRGCKTSPEGNKAFKRIKKPIDDSSDEALGIDDTLKIQSKKRKSDKASSRDKSPNDGIKPEPTEESLIIIHDAGNETLKSLTSANKPEPIEESHVIEGEAVKLPTQEPQPNAVNTDDTQMAETSQSIVLQDNNDESCLKGAQKTLMKTRRKP